MFTNIYSRPFCVVQIQISFLIIVRYAPFRVYKFQCLFNYFTGWRLRKCFLWLKFPDNHKIPTKSLIIRICGNRYCDQQIHVVYRKHYLEINRQSCKFRFAAFNWSTYKSIIAISDLRRYRRSIKTNKEVIFVEKNNVTT